MNFIFFGPWTNLREKSQNGQELVTDAWLVWCHKSTTRAIFLNFVMWGILHNGADWDNITNTTSQDILKIQNRLQVECCECLVVTHFSRWVGCARGKLRFHTVPRNLMLFLLMQVLRKHGIPTHDLWDLVIQVLKPARGNLKCEQQSRKHINNRSKSQNRCDNSDWPMSITCSQTQDLVILMLCSNFWEQRSSDQDDHQKKKSIDGTCVPHAQSRTRLVVWQVEFGPIANPDQIRWHQTPTCRHSDERKFHTWWVEQSSRLAIAAS